MYPGWRGGFYPKGLVHRDELRYAAEHLTSIEINGSFYALQKPSSFAKWRDETPDGFVFAVKGGRYVTHIRRLRDVELEWSFRSRGGSGALASTVCREAVSESRTSNLLLGAGVATVPVVPDQPTSARAVVIGGGIVGCSTAYHLAQLGWTDTVLVEQHFRTMSERYKGFPVNLGKLSRFQTK